MVEYRDRLIEKVPVAAYEQEKKTTVTQRSKCEEICTQILEMYNPM